MSHIWGEGFRIPLSNEMRKRMINSPQENPCCQPHARVCLAYYNSKITTREQAHKVIDLESDVDVIKNEPCYSISVCQQHQAHKIPRGANDQFDNQFSIFRYICVGINDLNVSLELRRCHLPSVLAYSSPFFCRYQLRTDLFELCNRGNVAQASLLEPKIVDVCGLPHRSLR